MEVENTPVMHLYQEVLRLLTRDIPDTSIRLKNRAGETLFTIGDESSSGTSGIGVAESDLEISVGGDYLLHLDRFYTSLRRREKTALKSVRELLLGPVGQTVRSHPDLCADIGLESPSVLWSGFYESLKKLITRTALLDNYERILQLNQRILEADEVAEILQIIMDMAATALNGTNASLILQDHRTGEMYFQTVSTTKEKTLLKQIRIPPGEGIAADIVNSGRAEIISDVASDPRAYHAVDRRLQQTTRNMAAAPLRAGGRVIGVLEVINSLSPYGFQEEDLEFLTNISAHAGLLIENARNRDELFQTNRDLDRKVSELKILFEVGRTLNTTLNPVELRRNLLHTIVRLFHLSQGVVFLHDPAGRNLIAEYALANSDGRLQEIQGPHLLTGVTDILLWMKANQGPFFFNDSSIRDLGPARRFRQDNAEYFKGAMVPALWLPFSDGSSEEPAFLFSLGEPIHEEGLSSFDLVFYRSLMNQIDAAFNNVRTYTIVSQNGKREEYLRRLFEKYVPDDIRTGELQVGEGSDERRALVTVLGISVRNLPALMEESSPSQLFEIIAEFFKEAEQEMEHQGGTILHYGSEGLLVLFGYPDSGREEASRALEAGRALIRRLRLINDKRKLEHRQMVLPGMAVHTGEIVVGNTIGAGRPEKIAVGPGYEVVSRLLKLTSFYGSSLLVSEDAQEYAVADQSMRELDQLYLPGESDGIVFFEPVERKALLSYLEVWKKAILVYHSGDYEGALSFFEGLKTSLGIDQATDLYIQRCRSKLGLTTSENTEPHFPVDS